MFVQCTVLIVLMRFSYVNSQKGALVIFSFIFSELKSFKRLTTKLKKRLRNENKFCDNFSSTITEMNFEMISYCFHLKRISFFKKVPKKFLPHNAK